MTVIKLTRKKLVLHRSVSNAITVQDKALKLKSKAILSYMYSIHCIPLLCVKIKCLHFSQMYNGITVILLTEDISKDIHIKII